MHSNWLSTTLLPYRAVNLLWHIITIHACIHTFTCIYNKHILIIKLYNLKRKVLMLGETNKLTEDIPLCNLSRQPVDRIPMVPTTTIFFPLILLHIPFSLSSSYSLFPSSLLLFSSLTFLPPTPFLLPLCLFFLKITVAMIGALFIMWILESA